MSTFARTRLRPVVLLIASSLALGPAWPQQAKDGDPTPRKGIDPIDAAKVKQFEARRWLGFGADGVQPEQVRSTVNGSIPGRRSCTTQIGPSAGADTGPAGQPVTSPRFGRGNDSTVIVTGSVINLCR